MVMLTPRELEVLKWYVAGKRHHKDIAREMGLSHTTVGSHVSSIYKKLGVHHKQDAIERARDLGVLS